MMRGEMALLKDCETVARLMKRISGKPAKMWGPAVVSSDSFHYVSRKQIIERAVAKQRTMYPK